MSEPNRLTSAEPYPAPAALPADYRRHRPDSDELRRAIAGCAAGHDWATLSWGGLIDALISIGRADIPLARLVEGHVDAVRILAQADRVPVEGALYGVWASRSRRTGIAGSPSGEGLRLNGVLRFASGAGLLDRALVPVWLDEEHHQLLDLDVRRLPVDDTGWATSAMEVSRSHTVVLTDVVVPGTAAVGAVDFYLRRPGFFPGGVGVAACWAGGAARIADLLLARPPASWSDAALGRLGEIRVQLTIAAAVVRSTARLLDEASTAVETPWQAIATEARAATANAVGVVLDEARRIGGAAGLAHDEDLTRAHHDLDLYVLQQNRDSDRAFLGGRYAT